MIKCVWQQNNRSIFQAFPHSMQHCSLCISFSYVSRVYAIRNVSRIPGSSPRPVQFIYSSLKIPMLRLVGAGVRGINSNSSSFLSSMGVFHIRLFRIRSAHLTGYFMLHVCGGPSPSWPAPLPTRPVNIAKRAVSAVILRFYYIAVSPSVREEEELLTCSSVSSL